MNYHQQALKIACNALDCIRVAGEGDGWAATQALAAIASIEPAQQQPVGYIDKRQLEWLLSAKRPGAMVSMCAEGTVIDGVALYTCPQPVASGELLSIAEDAIELMTLFHSHAAPDDTPDMNAIFPAAEFRKFVDGHANLMFRLHQAKKTAPPAQLTDTERLDRLSAMGGFMRGTSDGEPSYRIMMSNAWHPTLRAAIDEAIAKSTTTNSTPNEE